MLQQEWHDIKTLAVLFQRVKQMVTLAITIDDPIPANIFFDGVLKAIITNPLYSMQLYLSFKFLINQNYNTLKTHFLASETHLKEVRNTVTQHGYEGGVAEQQQTTAMQYHMRKLASALQVHESGNAVTEQNGTDIQETKAGMVKLQQQLLVCQQQMAADIKHCQAPPIAPIAPPIVPMAPPMALPMIPIATDGKNANDGTPTGTDDAAAMSSPTANPEYDGTGWSGGVIPGHQASPAHELC